MIAISYPFIIGLISALWILNRILIWRKTGSVSLKREVELILVYICLIVVARFTFFPLSKVDGRIQPLIFDWVQMWNFRINLLPFVYLTDYDVLWEMKVNLIGNTAMFIPIGIIWPSVYRKLDTHKKVIAAGVGFSLLIEILQLPFYDRVTDIDDLILNSLGFLIGYGFYLLVKNISEQRIHLEYFCLMLYLQL